ncbi:sugar porter family MFS transporter [Kutzneria buriramensis]|uniref:Sugar porter (SP) family MFS transporter n=1 Tax=Kutzneria buriramensis TaxID=1045776 RepID=A0A3E0IA22_9PSEU|nr:sugar porter family MFS transporter [Kutzneria buriramensis]REH54995.1 sugar porter (SP) family MFS transporter [Kutzneria buriramensis]
MQQTEGLPARRNINRGTLFFFGALGGILFGYDLGVISGVLLFIKKVWSLTALQQGFVNGALAAGAIIGALTVIKLADGLGRRRTIIVAASVFALGTIGCTFAPNFETLVAFRFIVGIAVGASSATVPTYLAELAPGKVRGLLSSLNQLMIVSGILIAYIVDDILADSGNWRAMIAAALIPAVILLVGMLRMPETPRWLLKNGREDEARAVLASTLQGEGVDAEFDQIKEVIRLDGQQAKGTFKDLTAKWARPALVVALILAIGQQFSGVNAVNTYAPIMFQNLGYGASAALLAAVVLGIVKVAFTVGEMFVVDRWGRKPLLRVGGLLMAGTLIVLGLCVSFIHNTSVIGPITLVLLILFLAGYELGWGAVVWVMIGEVFPLRVRGIGTGTASVVLWAATFTITFVFPVMYTGLGLAGAAWIFAAVCIVLVLLVGKFVPETKGRTLEQIELELRERVTV